MAGLMMAGEAAGEMMAFKNNTQLREEAVSKAMAEREAQDKVLRDNRVETELAAHIRTGWERARRYKEPIEHRMLQSLRQLNGRYDDGKAKEITDQGLPLIFMQLTAVKSRAAKSWIRDVLMPAGDKPWTLKPTPQPSLPPAMLQRLQETLMQQAQQFAEATGQPVTPQMFEQVMQQSKDRIKKHLDKQAETAVDGMAETIEDQLIEGGWHSQFDDYLSDVVDFPAGIMKAPVVRKRRKLKWSEAQQAGPARIGQGDPGGGQAPGVTVEEVFAPEAVRCDPFRIYPAPGVVDPDDGDMFEVHDYSADELHRLIGLPGYNEDAIREVLRDYEQGFRETGNWQRQTLKTEQERARGQHQTESQDETTIEAVEFWGSVQGKKLRRWGKSEEEVPDPEAMYDVMAILIDRHIICLRFNADPLGRKPYKKACFENVPGSFWGKGVPELIKDCQDVCNAAARALVANMGISSGPQVAVNGPSLAPGQNAQSLFPWKIWDLDFRKTGGSLKPIEFFQPNPMTDQLMAVYKEFSSLADEYSGIPAYSYGLGDSVGGAGRTASGLSMLMNAASKAIKNVVKHIDTGTIEPVIEAFYTWNMLWSKDPAIKGDAQVIARGAMSLVAKEQNQMRLQEFLAQTNNPTDMQIIGIEGRANMLRRVAQGVDMGSDEAVPSAEQLRQMMQAQQQAAAAQAQQQGQGPAPGESPEQAPGGQPMNPQQAGA